MVWNTSINQPNFLLRFSFVLEVVSNTRTIVWSCFQTPEPFGKKSWLRLVSQLPLSVFGNMIKHTCECLIHYWRCVDGHFHKQCHQNPDSLNLCCHITIFLEEPRLFIMETELEPKYLLRIFLIIILPQSLRKRAEKYRHYVSQHCVTPITFRW